MLVIFADFEQVNWLFCWLWTGQKLSSYFHDFEQVKNLKVILLTLDKSKIKLTTKLPWEKLCIFFFFFSLAITSCHRHSTLASQNCEDLHQLWLYLTTRLFFKCLGIQFLIGSLVTYGMPYHARGHQHSYLGKQRISLGVAIILSMCLCPHT